MAKVIFLHLSVIHSVHSWRVSASVHAGIPPPGADHPPPRADPPEADTTSAWEQTPGADTPGSRPPGSRHPPPRKQTPGYGQRAAGTHATGMHSCTLSVAFSVKYISLSISSQIHWSSHQMTICQNLPKYLTNFSKTILLVIGITKRNKSWDFREYLKRLASDKYCSTDRGKWKQNCLVFDVRGSLNRTTYC